MKTIISIICFGFLLQAGNAQLKSDNQLAAEFDKVLSQQFHVGEPGATALVSRHGKIIYKKAFGMANLELKVPMKVESVFRIGSITKQFTAVAILQLMEQGRLNLQDDITRFIPDYPMRGNKITIEHLLTQTSGIQDYSSIKDTVNRMATSYTTAEMIGYFKDRPLHFSPGTKWEYSNSNYFLLGYIIEKITGNTYGQYLEENFFKPLGMTRSSYASDTAIVADRAAGYNRGEKSFENAPYISMTQPYAAGAIQSTVEDLFKWNEAVHSNRLLKKATIDKALTKYKLTDGKETSYGYGWRLGYVYQNPSTWHGGLINGFITMEIYLPREDIFVTVLSNCQCNSPAQTSSRLAALAAGNPYSYKEITMSDAVLKKYEGVYENQSGQQRTITVSAHRLYIQPGRGPALITKAYKANGFFIDELSTIEFSTGQDGKTGTLVTKNLNGNETWTKTNKTTGPENGITVDTTVLESYAGEYEVTPDFKFVITTEQGKLFLQATGQDKFELFAETETKFFLKVNDATFEFAGDGLNKVTKAILYQGGRGSEARKIK